MTWGDATSKDVDAPSEIAGRTNASNFSSGSGPSIVVAQKRAPEWGKHAVVAGVHVNLAAWVRDLGRQGVTVEQVPSPQLDPEHVLEKILDAQPSVAILIGAELGNLAGTIIQRAPEIGIVIVSDDRDTFEAFEVIPNRAPPREFVRAFRRGLRMGALRAKVARLTRETERQRQVLLEMNADLKENLQRRHQSVCDTKRGWEQTFDAVDFPMAIVSKSLVVVNANRAYAALAHEIVNVIPGRQCFEVLFGRKTPCEGCPVGLSTSTNEFVTREGRTLRITAQEIDDGTGNHVCTYRDLTEEKARTDERIRSERMAALGEMSAGLAHELNNPIGGILAMSQALTRDPDVMQLKDLALDLADIEKAALRSKAILGALLRYARGADDDTQGVIDLEVTIRDALIVVQAEIRAGMVGVEVTIEAGASHAVGGPAAFQESMVHVLRNAIQAVESRTERSTPPAITIRTLREQDEVWIEVADNGPGLPSIESPSLLVPFVSNDRRAVGKGIGLALVSRLIENGMGRVELLRSEGAGATVRLCLKHFDDSQT